MKARAAVILTASSDSEGLAAQQDGYRLPLWLIGLSMRETAGLKSIRRYQ
jgi:hypothetical protein